jgi:hypothetical protein
MNFTESQLNEIYTVLVDMGGARDSWRDDFIYHHLNGDCSEWRFCGHFGFGGKYRVDRNQIDYYREDRTEKLDRMKKIINEELWNIG